MTRYERVQQALQAVEHRLVQTGKGLFLFADLHDHEEELGSVHIDAVRATLDWFCKRNPDHPICVAAASRRNTQRAFESFGYVHLPKEYPRLHLVDLNHASRPDLGLTVHLTVPHATSLSEASWQRSHATPIRRFTPFGHIWHREAGAVVKSPTLRVIDGTVSHRLDLDLNPVSFRQDQVLTEVAST